MASLRASNQGRWRSPLLVDQDDRFLQLEIRDDGRGLERDKEGSARRGVGLTNIRSRLEQLYGAEHRFTLENQAAGGVLVQISLPFRLAEKTTR
jgi:signal transduction histidine kinase